MTRLGHSCVAPPSMACVACMDEYSDPVFTAEELDDLGSQNTDDAGSKPFGQPAASDPIGDLKRWLQRLDDAKPTLVVTPETRDQIRGLVGHDALPELPCRIVVNPYVPEGMAYLFDPALLREALYREGVQWPDDWTDPKPASRLELGLIAGLAAMMAPRLTTFRFTGA